MTTVETGGAPHEPSPPSSTEPAAPRRARGRWRLPVLPLVIALVSLVGVALLMYPTVAAWFSQYEQSQRIDGYSEGIRDLGADTLAERLAEARAYNAAMTEGGAEVAAGERLPLANDPDQGGGYLAQLRGDEEGLMARIKIPAISVDLPVYHGTGDAVLEEGVGHLEGTALPVGGPSTHSVLTAHRGLATAELFTHLDRVDRGDTFTIEVFGEVLAYEVTETRVVEPDDTESLVPRQGEDLMTLVTCTPLGVNSHRILVTGERIIPTPEKDVEDAGKRPDIPTFPWWAVLAGGVLATAAVYVWGSGRPIRPRGEASGGVAEGSNRFEP